MRRGALLAVLLAWPALAAAQLDATDAQLTLIDAYVAREVAAASGGDVEGQEAALATARIALDAALADRGRVDLARARADVDARLAEIEARLAEVGRTCGPIPDTTPARARRDALVAVRAALERGPFRGR